MADSVKMRENGAARGPVSEVSDGQTDRDREKWKDREEERHVEKRISIG